MDSRYSTPRPRRDFSAIKSLYNSAPRRPEITNKDRDNAKDSDFWRFVGNVAPVAGTALGAVGGGLIGTLGAPVSLGTSVIGGAAAGAGIGGAIGSGVKALADGQANSMTADKEAEIATYDQESMQNEDRKQALLNALMRLRG